MSEYSRRSIPGFVRYVSACVSEYWQTRGFRIYVADCLYVIANNTRNFAGGYGIEKRYSDMFGTQPKKEENAVDIINDVLEKTGLEVRE